MITFLNRPFPVRDNGEISFNDGKSDDMADVMVFDLNGEVNEDQPLFELNENVIILVNNFIKMFKLNINKYVLYLVER